MRNAQGHGLKNLSVFLICTNKTGNHLIKTMLDSTPTSQTLHMVPLTTSCCVVLFCPHIFYHAQPHHFANTIRFFARISGRRPMGTNPKDTHDHCSLLQQRLCHIQPFLGSACCTKYCLFGFFYLFYISYISMAFQHSNISE